MLPPVGPLGRVPGWGEWQGWGGAVTSQQWPGALARELLAQLTATLEEQGTVLGAGFALQVVTYQAYRSREQNFSPLRHCIGLGWTGDPHKVTTHLGRF